MTSTYVIWLILTYHDVDISIWVDSHPTLHTSTGILMYNEEWWLITMILQPSVEWLFFVSKRHDDDDVSPHQPQIPLRDNRWHSRRHRATLWICFGGFQWREMFLFFSFSVWPPRSCCSNTCQPSSGAATIFFFWSRLHCAFDRHKSCEVEFSLASAMPCFSSGSCLGDSTKLRREVQL